MSSDYKPTFMWWELLILWRQLWLVGFAILIMPGTVEQLVICYLVVLSHMLMHAVAMHRLHPWPGNFCARPDESADKPGNFCKPARRENRGMAPLGRPLDLVGEGVDGVLPQCARHDRGSLHSHGGPDCG